MSIARPIEAADGRRDPADLVRQLDLEQKVRLLTGADFWTLHGIDAIELRPLVVSDGPVGVRGASLDERSPSANAPSPTAVAASWDEGLARRIGQLLGAEARHKGVDVVLAPVLNLHRTPYGGRHFECFSEDPLLTGRMGRGFIRGLQDQGVGATAKHFVANDSETQRFTVDVRVDQRTLREVYLAPFEVAVTEAGTWAVMAAYNSVEGVTMTESALLHDVLQSEWGFDGVTMSDWFAARSLDAALAGLDLCMPGPVGPWGDVLVEAVGDCLVPQKVVDDKVERILRLAVRTGALAGCAHQQPEPVDVGPLLRAAAAAGTVLARNAEVDGAAVLPIDAGRLGSIAVIGRHATAPRTLGGGSAQVAPPYVVSPLHGLRAALGDRVLHARGVRVSARTPVLPVESLTGPSGERGAELTFLGHDGEVSATEQRRACEFLWIGHFGNGLGVPQVAAVELRTTLTPDFDGDLVLGAAALGSVRLEVDGREILATTLSLPAGADPVEGFVRPPQATTTVPVSAGITRSVLLRYQLPEGIGTTLDNPPIALLQLVGEPAVSDDDELVRAVAMATQADIAVVVVGTTEDESEGFDRTTLALPGRQDELVRRVAAANPLTVVVVNSGAPVLLPWADEVAAVLLPWFPGQEFGNALADVLLGAVEPGGRLPVTWPDSEVGLLSPQPHDGVLVYDEGLLVGHRRYDREGRVPRYRFGHGLGYTTWEYLSAGAASESGSGATVTVRVRNIGDRLGSELVQVYASRPSSAVERPDRWLAGWARAWAAAGEAVDVTVRLAPRAFEHWDEDEGWVREPGAFVLHIGRSSGDLPLITSLDPTGSANRPPTAS